MLKGIPKILSPELLKVLCEMGHSDRLVISDGNFPAESMGKDAIVIQPTLDLSSEQKTNLSYGSKIHVHFPSSVVNLFSKADEKSLL